MADCFLALAFLCFLIGLVKMFAPASSKNIGASAYGSSAARGSRFVDSGIQPSRSVAAVPFRSEPASFSGSSAGGQMMHIEPQKLSWIRMGQRISVQQADRGKFKARVLGRICYQELWQQTRGPQSPWVSTGNAFWGYWLEGNLFLLNWQTRFYLMDQATELSDAEIQRDFFPHARKFSQSDQTENVYFAYPPAMWHIDDIGKFRVDLAEGQGMRLQPGAVGRFIHASGDSGRALVLEDYEGGGGGQNTVWTGYNLSEADITSG